MSIYICSLSPPFEFLGVVVSWSQALVCTPKEVLRKGYLRWQNIIDIHLISVLSSISVVSILILLIHEWKEQKQKLFGVIKLSTIFMVLIFNLTLTVLKLQGNYEASETIRIIGNESNFEKDTAASGNNGSVVTNVYNIVKEEWPILCYIQGLILQYSFLSMLLWLNVMSFDVWINFRRLRPSSDILRRQRFGNDSRSGFKNPKYIRYAIYAWIIPLINLIVTVIMDFLPDHLTQGYILPDIGKQRCAIKNYMVSKQARDSTQQFKSQLTSIPYSLKNNLSKHHH